MSDLNQIHTALERLFKKDEERIVFWNDSEAALRFHIVACRNFLLAKSDDTRAANDVACGVKDEG